MFFGVLYLLISTVCALGGKSIQEKNKEFGDERNYAVVQLCENSTMNIRINLHVRLESANETIFIDLRKTDSPEQISSDISEIKVVEVTQKPTNLSMNIKNIVFRFTDSYLKLHLNKDCLSTDEFMSSEDKQTIWHHDIDCSDPDVFCDDRYYEMPRRRTAVHIFWPNGVDVRKTEV